MTEIRSQFGPVDDDWTMILDYDKSWHASTT